MLFQHRCGHFLYDFQKAWTRTFQNYLIGCTGVNIWSRFESFQIPFVVNQTFLYYVKDLLRIKLRLQQIIGSRVRKPCWKQSPKCPGFAWSKSGQCSTRMDIRIVGPNRDTQVLKEFTVALLDSIELMAGRYSRTSRTIQCPSKMRPIVCEALVKEILLKRTTVLVFTPGSKLLRGRFFCSRYENLQPLAAETKVKSKWFLQPLSEIYFRFCSHYTLG